MKGPNSDFTGVLSEEDATINPATIEEIKKKELKEVKPYKLELVWGNIIRSAAIHGCGIYTFILIFTLHFSSRTAIYGFIYMFLCNIGISAAAHRLWAHRGYKVKLPLKIFLLTLQTLALQNSVYVWARDHRVHHKFTETNADPHNIKRGFFFAHMGWLLCKKHPDVTEKGKLVDMRDLEKDPHIMWQHRNYDLLVYPCLYVIPTLLFKWLTYETWATCFICGAIGRYSLILNGTWLVNSYAHYYGNKPYDRHIQATESLLMGYLINGEGFHNYHHVFPWDYRASEFRCFRGLNIVTLVIDFFALLGLAYDLKTVSPEMIKARALRTGDGSHPLWGWGDKDISKEHIQMTIRISSFANKNKIL